MGRSRASPSRSRAAAARTWRRAKNCFCPPEQVLAALHAFGTVVVNAPDPADVRFRALQPEPIDRDIKRLARLVRDGTPTVILCDNEGQAERLEELLAGDFGGPSPAALVIGVLNGGFTLPADGRSASLRVLTDHEIFRRDRRLRRARKYATAGVLEMITALTPGDFVVHLEHGVGIYRGLERIFVRESLVEVAIVEYAGGDRLNVPLYRIDQLERYRGAQDGNPDEKPPTLHAIGGKRWAQQRDRTRAAIREMTSELLDLYARRQIARTSTASPRHGVAAPARIVVPLRGHARPAPRHRRHQARSRRRAPHGPAARRRRRLRQNRNRRARRVQGRAIGTPGRGARAHDDSRRPAPAHVQRALRRFSGARGHAEPVSNAEGAGRRHRATRGWDARHRHRHAPVAEPRREVQATRPHRRGRRTPLRREAQGTPQATQARDRRAHADGDADSAHAAPVARGTARSDADADAAARPVARCSPSSSRGTTGSSKKASRANSIAAARCSSCTTASRRSTGWRSTFAASCRARASAWATGRCASASSRRSCASSSTARSTCSSRR